MIQIREDESKYHAVLGRKATDFKFIMRSNPSTEFGCIETALR